MAESKTEEVIIYVPKEFVNLVGYQTSGSVGFDICSNEDVEIKPKELKVVRTGIRIKVNSNNIFPAIFPRSSLPVKKKLLLANSVGVIDLDYCGKEDEIKLILYNFSEETVKIKKGERLAQVVFLCFSRPSIKITTSLEEFEEESRGGLGSTGD